MASADDVIVKDPQILHGMPVFRGTRVPVKALFDSLEAGETLEEFLSGFPSVSREMAIAALEQTLLKLPNSMYCSRWTEDSNTSRTSRAG